MNTTRLHIDALTAIGPINGNTALIREDALRLIVTELTEALRPCSEPVAKAEARRLAAGYPTFRASDDWLALIEEALADAPCDLIRKTCRALADGETFPPNKAKVKLAVSLLVGVRKKVLARAEAMLAEHNRRAVEQSAEQHRKEQRDAFKAKLDGRSPLEFIREEKDT